MPIRVFYDGFCPLCLAEMSRLRQYDVRQKIRFVDIQRARFKQDYPLLNWNELNARIHVEKTDGTMLTGLDATYFAWKTVGKGWVYAWLRWPIIRWVADGLYTGLARNRYKISFLLTGKRRCVSCAESLEKPLGLAEVDTS